MGKFKFLFLLFLAFVFICGIVVAVDSPNSFENSLSLMPISDSSVDVNQSEYENDTSLADSNSTDNESKEKFDSDKPSVLEEILDKDSDSDKDKEMNYDSKYYDGSIFEGIYLCNDLEQAFKDAKEHNRNVMIIFDGEACIYCENLKEEGLMDSDVQKEINENDIVLMTYTSESPELADELNVHGTPTSVIFDEDGNELGRIVGYDNPHQYLSELRDYNSK